MSDTSRHNLFLLLESTYGVTPDTSPAFDEIRHIGTTLGLSKEGFQSEELNADRQIRDFRHGVKSVSGDINFEFSYTSFDEILEAVMCGTWDGDVLKAGTTRRSFSILRHFTDMATKPYHLFTGCEFNTLSLTIPASGIVTGTFGVIGKGLGLLQDLSSLGVPTFNDPPTTGPFDSFTGSLDEGGAASNVVTEVSLQLENGLQVRNVVGSDETILPSIGRSNVTGNVRTYFESEAILEKFLNETESSLDITLVDSDGNQYLINLPRVKYNGGQPDVSGEGSIEIEFPIQALYDVTALSQLVITRTAA